MLEHIEFKNWWRYFAYDFFAKQRRQCIFARAKTGECVRGYSSVVWRGQETERIHFDTPRLHRRRSALTLRTVIWNALFLDHEVLQLTHITMEISLCQVCKWMLVYIGVIINRDVIARRGSMMEYFDAQNNVHHIEDFTKLLVSRTWRRELGWASWWCRTLAAINAVSVMVFNSKPTRDSVMRRPISENMRPGSAEFGNMENIFSDTAPTQQRNGHMNFRRSHMTHQN